jgi:hypothetical protein
MVRGIDFAINQNAQGRSNFRAYILMYTKNRECRTMAMVTKSLSEPNSEWTFLLFFAEKMYSILYTVNENIFI